MIRISNLSLSPDDAIDLASETLHLKQKIRNQYKLSETQIKQFRIFKKAVDARHGRVRLVYHVDLELKDEYGFLNRNYPNVSLAPDMRYQDVTMGKTRLAHRPVVIGFGPSGIFASYLLAKRGYRPLVLERGPDVLTRKEHWDHFQKMGRFDPMGSVLFGEGGAGTFSDGKLTTLVNDLRSREILDILVKAGAPKEILYLNKPHIGTDKLLNVIPRVREEIARLGGEIRFMSEVTNILFEGGVLKAVEINHEEEIPADVVLLGIGHSARDTFEMLHEVGVPIEQKPFSIGLRIEHPQAIIDKAQYGSWAGHKALGAADYKLSYHASSGRTAYTFCMCPGGEVVSSVSEPGRLSTNGMSLHARQNINANSALLVNVTPKDYPTDHPLAGMHFQRQWEAKAYQLAGGNYKAPCQRLGDFMNDLQSRAFGVVKPTYMPGVTFGSMTEILPGFVSDTLKEAIPYFDRLLKGFAMSDALLTGPETRSSSPIRILRNEHHESSFQGLYPMGEGAGYAGGIMSSAIDGLKTAEHIIMHYQSFDNDTSQRR